MTNVNMVSGLQERQAPTFCPDNWVGFPRIPLNQRRLNDLLWCVGVWMNEMAKTIKQQIQGTSKATSYCTVPALLLRSDQTLSCRGAEF